MAKENKENLARLKRMEEYIERDACEKAEEIDVIAEEEFYKEKNAYSKPRLAMVKKNFDDLEVKLCQQTVLNNSKSKNQGFRKILSARDEIVNDVMKSAEIRLGQVMDDRNKALYKRVLFQLIIQGLFKMMEPTVIIKVKKTDVQIAKGLLKQAQDYFNSMTGLVIVLLVNDNEFIPASLDGGVFLYSKNGSTTVDNTLHSRLDLVKRGVTPFIRETLFGKNLNRKHKD